MNRQEIKRSQTNTAERRKFLRLESHHLLNHERFRLQNIAGGTDAEHSTMKNISWGGLLFESKRQYNIGDFLKLEIELPGWEKFKNEFLKPDEISRSRPLVVLGRVVRVENISQGIFDIGVSFVSVDHDHREAVMKYVKQTLLEKAGKDS